jgi:hypothetical protein
MLTAPSTASLDDSIPNYSKRKLSNDERRAIYEELLTCSSDGVLPHGAYAAKARTFNCNWRTVERVWTRGRLSLRHGSPFAVVDSKFKGKPLQLYINIHLYGYRI